MSRSNLPRNESVAQDDQPAVLGPKLQECPVCGAIGLPERITDHDCQAFIERQPAENTCLQPKSLRVQVVIRITSSSGGSR